MEYQDIITVELGKAGRPAVRSRDAHLRERRTLLLASGMTEQEILDDFPELTREDILACLSYAADRGTKVSNV